MTGREVATIDPVAAVPKPVVTREFVTAFKGLGDATRAALADLGEFEMQTFARDTVLSRHRADELAGKRKALVAALMGAESALQKEFDRYNARRDAATQIP